MGFYTPAGGIIQNTPHNQLYRNIVPLAYWAPLTAFTTTSVTLWWLIYSPRAPRMLDLPNERSLHSNPVPRNGGIGITAGVAVAWMIVGPPAHNSVWIGIVILIAISLLDDLRGLPAWSRFCVHLTAAAMVSIEYLSMKPDWQVAMIAALAIAWMTNLYNFMDGSDGLAGGMALFGFSIYGIAALLSDNFDFALLNFSIAAAAAGFLVFNFHPARIFMGDVGSVPLGFLAGTMGIIGWQQGNWTWWFPLLVFSPFIVDASATLARRLLQREPVWRAHRDHYYQRLVLMGWGHRNTALAEYGLMALCGIFGLVSLFAPIGIQFALIAVLTIIYVALAIVIDRAWRQFLIT
jgi:UDP-N-acetylmuramyl pentapeptide phosphotransferase/UDP-N-acetylglucosamine-1-phosphate transferase